MCVFGGWWKGEEVSQLPIHNINLLKLHHKFCSGFPFHQSERGSGIHHGSSEEGLLRSSSSCCSVTQSCLFATPWTAAHQASLSFTISWSLLKLMSVESVMPSNQLILCHPLLLPSMFPSIRVFCNELTLRIRWPKHWSFSFNISPNEYSGLISFRIDWYDILTVQETLKSLLQHHSSKASILWTQPSLWFRTLDRMLFDYTDLCLTLTRQTFCQQSDVSAF